MRRSWVVVFLGFASACVDSQVPPALPLQAKIHYGTKVYLVDSTLGANLTEDRCTRLGVEMTTSTTATTSVPGRDGVKMAVGGAPKPIPSRQPHNCYVEVQARDLLVDQIE